MRTIEEKTTIGSNWDIRKESINNYLKQRIKANQSDLSVSFTFTQIMDHLNSCDNLDDFFQYCCRRYENLKNCHSFGSVDETENHENMMRNMHELQSKVLKPLEYLVKSIAQILGKKIPQNRK